MIFVTNLKFILSLIFFEKDLDMVFNNVLNKKRVFYTTKFVIFFEKYLDMTFNNVLNGKKGFLDYQNVVLTNGDNVQFS